LPAARPFAVSNWQPKLDSSKAAEALAMPKESALKELRAIADNCSRALPRFAGYRPHRETVPDCPSCWIVEGEALPLQPGAGPTAIAAQDAEWNILRAALL
jgi:hypothetical protein